MKISRVEYIYIYIYKYLLLESEYDMVKYFMSRLIYFMSQSLVKIKPESKMSSHITLTSVIIVERICVTIVHFVIKA